MEKMEMKKQIDRLTIELNSCIANAENDKL